MSLLDEILAEAVDARADAPESNEHAPSAEFAKLVIGIAERLRAVGRVTVQWTIEKREWELTLLDRGDICVSSEGEVCTWIPAEELSISIRADKKLEALDRAIVALGALTAEG